MNADNAKRQLTFEQFARLILDAVEAAGLEYLIGGAVCRGSPPPNRSRNSRLSTFPIPDSDSVPRSSLRLGAFYYTVFVIHNVTRRTALPMKSGISDGTRWSPGT